MGLDRGGFKGVLICVQLIQSGWAMSRVYHFKKGKEMDEFS